MINKIILGCAIFTQLFCHAVSDCAIYGECHSDAPGHNQNCPYSGPAKPLNDSTAIKTLQEYCPHLVKDTKNVVACCDTKQLQTFQSKISIVVSLLGRCPSCYRSFLNIMCDFMCHPDQSTFVNVTEVLTNGIGVKYVNSLQIFVSAEYINGAFNACKQVMMPTTGQLVFDLMCGAWGSDKCTAERLFKFMGTKGDQVPFNMDYITKVDAISPFRQINPPTYPCHKAVDNTTVACSCIDCQETCPMYSDFDDKKVENENWLVFEYYLFVFLFIVIFVILLLYKLYPVRVLFYLQKSESSNSIDAVPYYSDSVDDTKVSCRCQLPCHVKMEHYVAQFFTRLGEVCATHPWKILFLGSLTIIVFMCGSPHVDVTIDPVELWTSNGSRCRQERQYFNEHFGPFYRIQQVIVTAKNLENVIRNSSNGFEEFGPVFHKQFLLDFKKMQDDILKLGGKEHGLKNICVAPLTNVDEQLKNTKKCLVLSVWGYFKSEFHFKRQLKNPDGHMSDYLDQIKICSQNSYNPSCLADYGGPVEPATVFGGFLNSGESLNKSANFMKAKALMLTILIKNHLNKADNEPALKWEKLFVDYMKNYTKNKPNTMEISFLSERSIEDEVNRETQANIPIVLISYLAMFLYIVLTMGRFHFVYQCLFESKIMVGFGGVLLVFSSVLSSVAINSFFNVSVTLIALEVVPFLVLAVGVDNIFVLIHAFQNEPMSKNEPFEKYVGRVLGKVGPSILLTGMTESGCFFLGATSTMPCIKSFALYAAVALFVNFILQLTCFVSLICLDFKRRLKRRMDILCCFKITIDDEEPRNMLKTLFKDYFAPFIFNSTVRPCIIVIFCIWWWASALVLPGISLGLDQDIAMPSDSYILDYFKDMKSNLAIGPPVYFVVTDGLSLSNTAMQNILCNSQYCDDDSVTNTIYAASRRPSKTYIANPSSSWIDDYFTWLKSPSCCMVKAHSNATCSGGASCDISCQISFDSKGRPKPEDFNEHLSKFLSQNPTMGCVKGGKAAYGPGVIYRQENGSTEIGPYYFMAYHSMLNTSKDFYTALKEARNLADGMTKTIQSKTKTNTRVLPYSIFYIFYEQYLTIWQDSIRSITMSLVTVFLIVYLLTFGNLTASLIILFTTSIIIIDMMALLYYLDIQLNALSLVNIVMSIGIAVEFCGHIVNHYCKSNEEDKVSKAMDALTNIGPSVFSGITMTKFIGISVLWFSHSAVFRIYFFQMYLGVVLLGVTHGLVFLPVLLSYFGPMSKKIRKNETSFQYDMVTTQDMKEEQERIILKSNNED